jgi:hypothetical protein
MNYEALRVSCQAFSLVMAEDFSIFFTIGFRRAGTLLGDLDSGFRGAGSWLFNPRREAPLELGR